MMQWLAVNMQFPYPANGCANREINIAGRWTADASFISVIMSELFKNQYLEHLGHDMYTVCFIVLHFLFVSDFFVDLR